MAILPSLKTLRAIQSVFTQCKYLHATIIYHFDSSMKLGYNSLKKNEVIHENTNNDKTK